MVWESYNRYVKADGKYYCIDCAHKLYGGKNLQKALLSKSISFYDWCYNNLSKDEADEIMLRWDYELNKCSPKNVCFSSGGFKRKGYYFKCLNHPEHYSEIHDISSFTSSHGSLDCYQCKSIATTNPEFFKYFVNIQDAYTYSHGSMTKVLMKCPECGFQKKCIINDVTRQGFSCNKCGDGISYPEKFMFGLLEQLNVDFQTQLSNVTFEWCGIYKYDFYIPLINCIIETHGLQHYEEQLQTIENVRSLEDEQANDILKEYLAKENGINEDHYIVIDCRYSNLEWIKDHVLSSKLAVFFDLSNIDWNKCHLSACKNIVKLVCDLWNEHKAIKEIIPIVHCSYNTVVNYLKQGYKIGWSDYNPQLKKKIQCITTGEIFNSSSDACKKYNLRSSNLSGCLHNRQQHCGISNDGEKLLWKFIEVNNNK